MRLSIYLVIAFCFGLAASAAFGQTKHVIFTYVDHFEPNGQGEVDLWVDNYTPMAARHVDSDGKAFQHSWFMLAPANWFDFWGDGTPPNFAPLDNYAIKFNEATYAGVGEIDYHLHHGVTNEAARTEATAVAEVIDWTNQASERMQAHGAWITAEATPQRAFGFVHGMWALDNTRNPNGYYQWCGVNAELALLSSLGVYAEFTFPAWGPMEPLNPDTIFYAQDDPLPGSYKNPANIQEVAVGVAPYGDLMIIQGPNTNTNIGFRAGAGAYNHAATLARMNEWVSHDIKVVGQDDWIFVKVYTHGCFGRISEDATSRDYQWGTVMENFLTDIETAYRDANGWDLHYASAREMYNIAKAAEAGMTGNPGDYRNFEIPPYANMLILTSNSYMLTTYADGVVEFDILDANDTSVWFAMKEFDPAASLVQEWSDSLSQWVASNAVIYTGTYGELLFVDNTPAVSYRVSAVPPTPVSLTVISGSGGGNYLSAQVVNIDADAVPAGMAFVAWTGDVTSVANVSAPNTTITMPRIDVTVTATYQPLYSLTVINGSGGGEYVTGTATAIFADQPTGSMSFLKWAGDVAGVANVNEADTTVTIPAADAAVTAIYKYRGDLNADGIVNIVDLNMVLIDWDKTGLNISDPNADADDSGAVNIIDLNMVLIDWDQSSY